MEENDGQTLVVDLDPRRFCSGDSGRPIYDGPGNAVGPVSRWWGGLRGNFARVLPFPEPGTPPYVGPQAP